LVVEDVLWLDVPVAYIAAMNVFHRLKYLPHDSPQLLLTIDGKVFKRGEGQVLHDEVSYSDIPLDIESLVVADRRVVELLEGDEVLFDIQNLLFLSMNLFYRINFICRLIYALENGSIATLTQFFQKFVVLEKLVLLDRLVAVVPLWRRKARLLRGF
jgi:hypothetical protein